MLMFRVTPQMDLKIIARRRHFAKILAILLQDLANLSDRAKYLAQSSRFGNISETLTQIFGMIVTTWQYLCDDSGKF